MGLESVLFSRPRTVWRSSGPGDGRGGELGVSGDGVKDRFWYLSRRETQLDLVRRFHYLVNLGLHTFYFLTFLFNF